jgi:glycosyltransferase involved in cell wall biosynthesis
MATGLPIVSTTAAYLGIEAVESRDLLVADAPDEFAADVVALLKNGERRVAMGRAAREFVEENYSWDAQLEQLDLVLEKVTMGLQPEGNRI